MSIQVICPSCHTRFKVSDKFAGKSGACPKCKGKIEVPAADQEVQVHAPEEFSAGGARGASGKLTLKPISRTETKVTPVAVAAIVGSILLVGIVTLLAGEILREQVMFRAIGLLFLSPLIAIAGYTFLRDDELEPHRGKSLYLRAALCGIGYTVLWAVFGYVAETTLTGEIWEWIVVAPPFLVTGGLCALVCFDLDFGSGFFHYCFYLVLTMALRWAAGMPWVWNLGS
ncbi:MAG: hypothetical protein U9N87_08020 [Planctomycetota bacterium]|nr:hypothetical protein [Planctomycetota bacterium]